MREQLLGAITRNNFAGVLVHMLFRKSVTIIIKIAERRFEFARASHLDSVLRRNFFFFRRVTEVIIRQRNEACDADKKMEESEMRAP